jgi:microcystin degradation protein MlrC
MRIFIASLATETNTFAPFPTGRAGFEERSLGRDCTRALGPLSGPMRVFRRMAQAAGDEVVESLSAFAQPSGRTVRRVYEDLRDEILGDLQAAGEVDVVLLMLHGAMAAQGYDDCEGDIIGRARQIAPAAVIGVELDPHCHLSDAMVRGADVIVIGKEYPHVDFEDRAAELFDVCRRTAAGKARPVAVVMDLAMIGFYPTFDPPMSDVVASLKGAEAEPGILTASLAHGFPWGDVADVGTRVLVYGDGNPDRAAAVCARIGREVYALRKALLPDYQGIEVALDWARGMNGSVVLGDFADNPGGGASGDSTFFLRAMLERRVEAAVSGFYWDPLVAQLCADAGVGATLTVRLGGKCGPASGDPLDLEVEVMAVAEDHDQGVFGARQPMGRCVWLRSAGIDIAVSSIRTQVFEPDAFTGLGIDLAGKRLIVVKSSNHYQAGFRGKFDHLRHVAGPGAMSIDFTAIPYTKRDGPFFPRVEDPWAKFGEPEVSVVRPQRVAARGADPV